MARAYGFQHWLKLLKGERSVYMTMEPVKTEEDARCVLVARALYYRYANGYGGQIMAALKAIGLGDYLPTEGVLYRIKTDKLRAALPETVEVTLRPFRTPAGNCALLFADHVQNWSAGLTEEDWEAVTEPDKAVDFHALVARFGHRRELPPIEGDTDAIKAVWRDLVNKALHWGDNNNTFGRVCDELENVLRHMGFGEFLPPEYVSAEVTWNGVTVQLESVRAGRDGQPLLDAVRAAFVDRAYRAGLEQFKIVVTGQESDDYDDDDDDDEEDD